MIDDEMDATCAAYAARVTARLTGAAAALDRLAGNPADGEALDTLRETAHQLAGSGTTYGFLELSRVAGILEADAASGRAGDVPRWRDLVGQMQASLRAAVLADVPPRPVVPPRPGAARIMSIEDDPDYAAYLTALLESAGYHVQICSRPDVLEDQIAAFRPDLLLMDVVLPGATGYDLGRTLRASPAYATLPILFLTTQQEVQARLDGIAAGGDDYLVKSDPPALLLTTIAARVERARLLRELVERDGLTQLFTHTAFAARVDAVLAQRRREPGQGSALAMLDVDHFKAINDRYGHSAGDSVLRALAAFLAERVRAVDVVGRYGGEEFGIVFQGATAAEAARVLTTLGAEFAEIFHDGRGAGTFHVTFSAGVAALTERMTARDWIETADAALYEAKAAGRNRVCISPEG